MADWSTYLTAGLTGGAATAVVTFARFLRDEGRHRAEERRADAAEERQEKREPLERRAREYGLVDQATLIQQRAIETLEGQVEDLKLRHQMLRQESDQEIAALKAENQRLIGQVRELYRTMGEMEVELREYRRRGAQGA